MQFALAPQAVFIKKCTFLNDGGNIPFKQGPRNRLCRTVGAAAPSEGRELREVSNRRGFQFKQGPRDWLRQTAGAAAPSGGRELREANDRGGNIYCGGSRNST